MKDWELKTMPSIKSKVIPLQERVVRSVLLGHGAVTPIWIGVEKGRMALGVFGKVESF